ncbi:serine kinase [Gemmobacter sp. 24YEA27]|uniref:HPr kinase/phosphorylase n=1 Tax=Gemmobacter sp. 24YEA27 TaxID=3040672 RepID=UPI0024B38375|nr:serine kinase [Gemmobacter sp. 24YEA27]
MPTPIPSRWARVSWSVCRFDDVTAAQILHASSVAIGGRGVLILGPSGAGKSALALKLMAYGAALVADDQTALTMSGGGVEVSCPSQAISGLIEARGIGILRVTPSGPVPLALVVDLGRAETERLPPRRHISILGYELPLVLRAQNDHLAEGLLALMTGWRQE